MARQILLLLAILLSAAPSLAGVNASAEFSVTQDWGSGANATLRIVNHGTTAIPAWPMRFNFDADITPYNNAVVSNHVGNLYVLNRESYYSSTIPAGGSIFFDMRVTPGGLSGAEPRNIRLAGQALGGPVLTIADASGAEGDTGTRTLTFTVTLSEAPASGQSVTANYSTTADTATAGSDFTSRSGTLTFSGSQVEKTITISIRGDLEDEGDEVFRVELSSVTGAAVTNSSARGTILDDDYTVEADIDGTTVFEGDDGTTGAIVTVQLDRPAAKPLTVRATTQAGTATATDFQAVTQVLTFRAGDTMQTLAVPVIGDLDPEPTETLLVSLTQASTGLIIADPVATVTIHDNDGSDFGTVLINEVCAAPGNRAIRRDPDSTPRLGMGIPWMAPEFGDDAWFTGSLPAGHGHGGLATNVGAVMAGLTPSLYLRKEFSASASQATASGALTLDVEFDDGFIAYLNGVEVARANMGAPQHFCYARQPAYNARPSSSPVAFNLGPAAGLLVEGTNVLAIQAHNAVVDPGGNRFELSPSFRIDAGLRLASPASTLVASGSAGGSWKYFPGLAEPSGGVIDPVLLTGGFTIPPGAEDDFDDPDDFADWVELHNPGATPVEIGGWTLSDNPSNPGKWSIPTGTTIPGFGHLLVLCDRREELNGTVTTQRRTLVSGGATWKYHDLDAAPPAGWKSPGFADAGWASGPAPLGYSTNNEDGATTVIAGGQNTHFTNYFRRAFTVDDPATIIGDLTVRYQRDDGLVIWLNGVEVARDNMDPGIPTHTTPAADTATGEANWYTATVPATALASGRNVLAVEVHQASPTSSDVRFDLELAAWEEGPSTSMIHASFALKADGEPLTLHTDTGSLVDAVSGWPKQDSFYSWGRSTTDPARLGFQEATPGAPNSGEALPARVAKPRFLGADGITPLPSGFYNATQSLVLQCATPGATIRFTTDGSEPLASGNGSTYNSPIPIARVNERTAVVIRARAFAPGMLPSRDISSTYLIDQHPSLRTLPVISLVADAGDNFYLPQGIMAIEGGSHGGNGIWQPGDISSYNVPQHRGSTTERKTSVELIHPDGSPGFRDKVAIRMAGSGYTRPRYRFQRTNESPWALYTPPEKGSMNLIWRNEIGADQLDFELFPGWPTTRFGQLRLRAGNNDPINPFITDEYVRRLLGEMGHDSLRGLFAMLYVNGSFKGIYNLCERLRNDTFQEHFRSSNDWDVKYNNEYSAGDRTEHDRFRAIYDRDLSIPANYAAMQEAADLVNFADYYLLNIYANMWDWATWGGGANNYVLYRERVSTGIWRFTVWDAESGFHHQGYFNPPSFDIITENLTGGDDTNELATIWKRLVGVPPFNGSRTKGNAEFRLLVADRIHKHFFNGGILDDRDSGSRIHTLKNELRSTVKTGIEFMASPWAEDWFANWIAPGSGRRAHLFGPTDTQLADAGVWPSTAPPTLSRHGGDVTLGQLVTLSGIPAGGAIYFTTDGSDPRLNATTPSPSAQTYRGAIPINDSLTFKARARSASGEWSALTEARFSVPLAAPTADTLVVSEIMFNPPPVSTAEQSAGFSDSDDFEFIRLTNVGPDTLDLDDLRFSDGVTFDFSGAPSPSLAPGASVLVVGHLDAFRLRYGTAHDAIIAGEFLGNLKNGGETLRLELADPPGTVLHTIAYRDRDGWPLAADGLGSSLLLIDPTTDPDPTVGWSWTASAHPGGHPGGSPQAMDYETWQRLSFQPEILPDPSISGPLADPDLDRFVNFMEYALGMNPLLADAAEFLPRPMVVRDGGVPHLGATHVSVPTAIDAIVVPKHSTDLENWFGQGIENHAPPASSTSGHLHHFIRLTEPITPSSRRGFIRLHAAGLP